MNLKKKVVAAGLVLAAAAGCSSSYWNDDSAPAYYTPSAYYQTVNNVYECYYINSMDEAYALENVGLCPRYAIPTLMPVSWEETYWDYYSSPAYYNTYVPLAYRRTYVNVTCVHFHQTYSSQITKLTRTAVYKSSKGGTFVNISKASSFTSGTTKKVVNYSVPSQTVKVSTRNYSSAGRH
jgi:hypothetical protein